MNEMTACNENNNDQFVESIGDVTDSIVDDDNNMKGTVSHDDNIMMAKLMTTMWTALMTFVSGRNV